MLVAICVSLKVRLPLINDLLPCTYRRSRSARHVCSLIARPATLTDDVPTIDCGVATYAPRVVAAAITHALTMLSHTALMLAGGGTHFTPSAVSDAAFALAHRSAFLRRL